MSELDRISPMDRPPPEARGQTEAEKYYLDTKYTHLLRIGLCYHNSDHNSPLCMDLVRGEILTVRQPVH